MSEKEAAYRFFSDDSRWFIYRLKPYFENEVWHALELSSGHDRVIAQGVDFESIALLDSSSKAEKAIITRANGFYLVDLNGGDSQKIADFPSYEGVSHTADNKAIFSPDGKFFVYSVSAGDGKNITFFQGAVSSPDKRIHLFTYEPSDAGWLCGVKPLKFSPDGKTLLFTACQYRHGTELFAMDVATKHVRQSVFWDDPRWAFHPDLFWNLDNLLYLHNQPNETVHSLVSVPFRSPSQSEYQTVMSAGCSEAKTENIESYGPLNRRMFKFNSTKSRFAFIAGDENTLYSIDSNGKNQTRISAKDAAGCSFLVNRKDEVIYWKTSWDDFQEDYFGEIVAQPMAGGIERVISPRIWGQGNTKTRLFFSPDEKYILQLVSDRDLGEKLTHIVVTDLARKKTYRLPKTAMTMVLRPDGYGFTFPSPAWLSPSGRL